MITLHRFVCGPLIVALGLAAIVPARALANGGKAKLLRLGDSVAMSDGRSCDFLSEIDPTLFTLLTLKDRYRAVRIQVRNWSGRRLSLSRQTDKAALVWDGRRIPGIIALDQHDTSLWDQLSPEMRRTLVYPPEVEPGEEESLFVFVPADGIEGPPREIQLALTSMARPITLRHRVAAAKR